MATTAVTVEQYLRTAYSPDCDYVDGEVLERNLGEREHAWVQGRVMLWFGSHEEVWQLQILPEQRVQVSAERFRIPDVSVLAADAPYESIIRHPPFIVVEVVSPDDRMNALRTRLDDYQRMGVPNIWIIDPYKRAAWMYIENDYVPVSGNFIVPGTPIHLPLEKVFAGLPPQS